MLIKKVAEAIENVILEDMALKKISSYSIDLIPDDNRIVITYVKVKTIDKVEVKYEIKKGQR